MKRVFSASVTAMILALSAAGQPVATGDNALIDNYINSTITIRKEKIASDAVASVFKGTFYYATPAYNRDGAVSSCEKYCVVIEDGKISELDQITETRTLERLGALIRKEFVIKDEADASLFESALDALYPLDWSDEPSDKRHFFSDGRWIFTRGRFFDSLKAFIITPDPDGGILQVDFDLEAVTIQ
jgi:hypothetical protein